MELKNRNDIESRFMAKMNKLSSKHRRELINLMGNPPDIRNVPTDFWQRVEQEEREQLAAFLMIIMMGNAEAHGMGTDSARMMADAHSVRRAAEIARDYARNSYAKALMIQRQNSDRLGGPITLSPGGLRSELEKVFGPTRDEALVATETTRASVEGAENAMRTAGMVSQDDEWETRPWMTQTGPCPICEPLDGLPRSVWGRVHPKGPPIHPRCACAIQYARG
ncbi:MAG: hypothetical protein KDA80_19055 [Planctomycetaceae bacterium]|nr:hypothetical protein [Planctomycetaceae bacterium]